MCQISFEMKIVILLNLFFAIELSAVVLIFANFNSEIITTSNLQTLRSTTVDQKLETWNISVAKEAKTVNNDYPTPVKKRFGTKENSYNKKNLTTESELGYKTMQEEKNLREQLHRLNLRIIQKNQNYLQELKNDKRRKAEYHLKSYNASFNHPTRFSSSRHNLYPPHLYLNAYDIHNFDKRFIHRKKHPKILSENQDDKLKEIEQLSKQNSAYTMFPNQSSRLEEESLLNYKQESPLPTFPNQYGRSGEEIIPPCKERVLLVFPNHYDRLGEKNVLPYKKKSPYSMFSDQDGRSREEAVPSYKENSVPLVFPNQYSKSEEESALSNKKENPLSNFPSKDSRSGEEAAPSYKEKNVLLVFSNQYRRSGENNVLPYKAKSPPSIFSNQDGRSGKETVPSYKDKKVLIVFPDQYGRLGDENALHYNKESPLSMFSRQDSMLREETFPSDTEKSVLLLFPNQYGRSGEENAQPYKEKSKFSMFPNQDDRSGEESFPPYKKERVFSIFPYEHDRSRKETLPSYKEERALRMFLNRNDRSEEENDVPPSMFPSKSGRSAEENILPYKEETAHFSEDTSFISMPTASNIKIKLPNLSNITTMDVHGIAENSFIKPNEDSRIEKRFFKRNNFIFRSINQITSNVNKIATRSKNSENNQFKKQELTNLNDSNSDKKETLHPHFDFSDFSTTNEKEKTESPFHISQLRYERNNTLDDIEEGNLNKLLHNRVYFEKMPENTNFSWFVYVNCSRDKCLLTNNTDESELSSEGWILHNCTHYGCIEMYPRIESIRKIIGLILLVFSLCVLKAVVFLLIFYYCRRMKLSRNAPGDADLNEEKSIIDEKKLLGKNHENDQNREVIIGKFKTASSNQEDIYSSDEDKEPNSLVSKEVEGDDLKNQNVNLCLINSAPNKNILIPKKSFEKKVHNKILAIPKCKSYRSSIPRLERWDKCKDSKAAEVETKRADHDANRKTPGSAKETPGGGRDILLMNLDSEEDNSSLCMSAKIEDTSMWSTLLENECQSFVSIDLSDSKI